MIKPQVKGCVSFIFIHHTFFPTKTIFFPIFWEFLTYFSPYLWLFFKKILLLFFPYFSWFFHYILLFFHIFLIFPLYFIIFYYIFNLLSFIFKKNQLKGTLPVLVPFSYFKRDTTIDFSQIMPLIMITYDGCSFGNHDMKKNSLYRGKVR